MQQEDQVPKGTILFSTVGLPYYGFDVFSLNLTSNSEARLTDAVSVNFNAQFINNSSESVAFVSERSGSSQLYKTNPSTKTPEPLPNIPTSLFHDRPVIHNDALYFISAHEKPEPGSWFKSWAALYRTDLLSTETVRLTPPGFVDMSPAISRTGKFAAVASYGSKTWSGDFRDLATEIVVFDLSAPDKRFDSGCKGGWPTFSGDGTVFFHRKCDDGWWSVFRLDLTEDGRSSAKEAVRMTPPGVHAMTPAASHDGRWIAVATRRKDSKHRHIEMFDLETKSFKKLTEVKNPNYHHYNPFVSYDSTHVGYHRFRGESVGVDCVAKDILPVTSPIEEIELLRTPMSFPSFSPDGEYIATNGDFFKSPGLMVMKSDGSKRWTVVKESNAFFTVWSPTEKGVIFTAVGPIFESVKATVQIARVEFDPNDLDDRESVPSKVKLLTRSDVGNNAFPSVSPDGKWIVFRSGRSGFKNLYVTDAVEGETGSVRRLTDGEWIDTMPCWSPDGEWIAFSSNRHDPGNEAAFSVYMVRPDGTGLRRVYVAGGEGSGDADRERVNHVCFGPDSRWLVFTANFGGVLAEPVSMPNQFQPYGELYVCRVDGSGLRRLTWNAWEDGTPAWHRRGGGLGLEGLSLGEVGGDGLSGQFDEPLWLTCDV